MIYRIAKASKGSKGIIAVYDSWIDDGKQDIKILINSKNQDIRILFLRSYFAVYYSLFYSRIIKYIKHIDIVCGWEIEKIYMLFKPLNPNIYVIQISAMNFNTFGLIKKIQNQIMNNQIEKKNDLFITISERKYDLKNARLLVDLLAKLERKIRITGYGRLSDESLEKIEKNHNINFIWKGKAKVYNKDERYQFLRDLAESKAVLITSYAEGYCKVIGEALLLKVPILLYAKILTENWVHLSHNNCVLFIPDDFEIKLNYILNHQFQFKYPRINEGNAYLQKELKKYFKKNKIPLPKTWFPLGFAAINKNYVKLRETE
ncbi:hypothetical protein [Candidatus Harpocratesius sp.]